jgi:NhaP-type Na+/H+ or K+/H+ antiporter
MFIFVGGTAFFNMQRSFNIPFIALNFAFIIIARILFVYVGSFIIGIWTKFKDWPIPYSQWFILFWSGLPRGVLSFALITTIGNDSSDIFISTVQYTVIITTVVIGGITPLI